jgi:hypothetical protein
VKKLWLWKNGDDLWAFDNPYPCHPGGDPMTLGEPIATATLLDSVPGLDLSPIKSRDFVSSDEL